MKSVPIRASSRSSSTRTTGASACASDWNRAWRQARRGRPRACRRGPKKKSAPVQSRAARRRARAVAAPTATLRPIPTSRSSRDCGGDPGRPAARRLVVFEGRFVFLRRRDLTASFMQLRQRQRAPRHRPSAVPARSRVRLHRARDAKSKDDHASSARAVRATFVRNRAALGRLRLTTTDAPDAS